MFVRWQLLLRVVVHDETMFETNKNGGGVFGSTFPKRGTTTFSVGISRFLRNWLRGKRRVQEYR